VSASRASALLLDLDGTLVDSAPDLHATANAMRAERGLAPLPFVDFRPFVSRGGRAMLASAFPQLDESERDALLPEFLERYHGTIFVHSALFPGMADVLAHVEGAGIPWGIVTNKPGWLSRSLLAAMALDGRCGVVIAGDTLAQRKPDPEPVHAACRALSADVGGAVFVGDDLRDVQAGRAAGCRTVVAAWGYVPARAETDSWGADLTLETAAALLELPWLRAR
jgi:N-acetyl-D-muramate 6-phosphate phosphatase